jgi:outer membrane protein assembly factor BamD
MAVGRSGAQALILALLLSVAGCGATQKEVPLDDLTAADIFKLGELELESGKRRNDAVRYFQEVERLYPYTEFAKRALIMQAFTLHEAENYEEARAAAQRYLDSYPGSDDAAYAQYLLALSYSRSIIWPPRKWKSDGTT